MGQKLVTIVTEGGLAQRLGPMLGRLLGLSVEVHSPGSMVRLVDQLIECDPDMVVYSYSDERSVLAWIKAQGLERDTTRLRIFTYKGFGMLQMTAIERLLTRRGGVKRLSFAA